MRGSTGLSPCAYRRPGGIRRRGRSLGTRGGGCSRARLPHAVVVRSDEQDAIDDAAQSLVAAAAGPVVHEVEVAGASANDELVPIPTGGAGLSSTRPTHRSGRRVPVARMSAYETGPGRERYHRFHATQDGTCDG
jgi:hypothetical protein